MQAHPLHRPLPRRHAEAGLDRARRLRRAHAGRCCRCCICWCRQAAPSMSPAYVITLVGKIMCYAIVAVAMDLIWGYARHPVARPRPVLRARRLRLRHVPDAPDRPRRLLPVATCRTSWSSSTGRNCPGTGPAATPSSGSRSWCSSVPALVAFIFGFFAFRSRIKGVYFSIITQALTFAAMLLFFRNETGFGGNNGFTDFKRILGYSITSPEMRAGPVRADGADADGDAGASAAIWSPPSSAAC